VLVHVLCLAIWLLSLLIALCIVWIGLSHFIFCLSLSFLACLDPFLIDAQISIVHNHNIPF
jgi:hypothetical protein